MSIFRGQQRQVNEFLRPRKPVAFYAWSNYSFAQLDKRSVAPLAEAQLYRALQLRVRFLSKFDLSPVDSQLPAAARQPARCINRSYSQGALAIRVSKSLPIIQTCNRSTRRCWPGIRYDGMEQETHRGNFAAGTRKRLLIRSRWAELKS